VVLLALDVFLLKATAFWDLARCSWRGMFFTETAELVSSSPGTVDHSSHQILVCVVKANRCMQNDNTLMWKMWYFRDTDIQDLQPESVTLKVKEAVTPVRGIKEE
ncbi:hypothetical protein GOODEAATRI_008491, partial [Goodea atripinnis]